MSKVLILDANQRSALAVTRALGRQGIEVITADDTASALSGCSRHSVDYKCYFSPRSDPERFIDNIQTICNEHAINLILPMTELTTLLLLQHQKQLAGIILPFAPAMIVDSIADKFNLMKTATSLGIPVPDTWYIADPQNPDIDLQSLPYPLVMKPGKSWQETPDGWMRCSVRIASSPAEARHIMDTDPGFHYQRYLLQECVAGTGQGVFALYNQGSPLAFFSHCRLREKPPWGGVSVLSQSIALQPSLLEPARKLLDHAGWHGIAMVEFKVAPDGTPYLMEINTRFWGSLQLAIDAGVDFPYLLYQVATGQQPDPVETYRTGIKLRWLLGDLDSLYIAMKDKKTGFRGKLARLGHFLLPSFTHTRHEINRWDDMGPFRFELIQYLKDLRS